MKIYTGTGDDGKTALMGGKRVSKSDPRVESYGNVDELNSIIGLCVSMGHVPENIKKILTTIQHLLFVIGGELANPASLKENEKKDKNPLPTITENHVKWIEKNIDDLSTQLPPLRSFILPGGHQSASFLHFCRAVCRRTERSVVKLLDNEEDINPNILIFLNRLSDLFFIMARYVNQYHGIKDIPWHKKDNIITKP